MNPLDNPKTNATDLVIEAEEENQIQSNSTINDEKRIELLDSLQRLQADFINYRRHSEKEKEELAEFVRGNVIFELLPIVDDYERLINSKSNHSDIKNGALLIYKNLMSILHGFGLMAFVDKGKEFDPNYHEALSVQYTDLKNDGKIVETWQKGYKLKERLLRPAKVVVGAYNAEQENSEI